MAELSHSERLDRLEQVVHILAEDQVSLQKIVSSLATETRQAFERVAEHQRETGRLLENLTSQMQETERRMRTTDERFRATDERFRVTDERFRATGERIDNLVVAIGEFIRRSN